MNPAQLVPGQLIPTPPDFPIQWHNPSESAMFWTRDVMHFPYANVPMLESFVERCIEAGINRGASKFDMPIRFTLKFFNNYYYNATQPVLAANGAPPPPPSPEEMANHPLVIAVMTLPDSWENQHLPELKRIIARGEALDLRGATAAQLVTHLDNVWADTIRAWQVHFEVAHPMLPAMSLLDDMYQDLFGADTFGAYHLMQGLDNKSLEADRGLFALSRDALNSPAVLEILQSQPAEQVMTALRASAACQSFVQEFDRWLQEFGQRGDLFDNVTSVGWIEDPTPAIHNLQDNIKRTDEPDLQRQKMAAERGRLISEVRATLAGYPEPVRMQFEGLLRSAQAATVLQEDHNYWIDQRASYQLRRVYLEVGRRLTDSGTIADPLDVFYLYAEEARAALIALQASSQSLQEVVAERKASVRHFAAVQPPPMVGTLPEGDPPDDPMTRAGMRFFGTPPKPNDDPNTINGAAGSPGKITGKAKVIRTLSEAGKLTKGDILVTETTAPPWTPLFATASAIVTDAGGILSHCAVVAREYAIPAVVGTTFATHLLQDGMMIEVDGDNGIVRIM